MADRKRPRQRARITEEQVYEMMRLQRQGESIQDIARAMGCHRQTVRMHLNKNQDEVLRNEARKQIMIEAIKQHFQELASYAGKELNGRFQPSPAEGSTARSRDFFLGPLALPGMGSPLYVAAEWSRLHDFSSRDCHLIEALQEHNPVSPIWERWKEWDRHVGAYREVGGEIRRWLYRRVDRELKIVFTVGRDGMDVIQPWLFGNILRLVGGEAYDQMEVVRRGEREDWVSHGAVIMRAKNGQKFYERLQEILLEARMEDIFLDLERVTARIKERQPELQRLAKGAVFALESIELVHAYPNRCYLCPM